MKTVKEEAKELISNLARYYSHENIVLVKFEDEFKHIHYGIQVVLLSNRTNITICSVSNKLAKFLLQNNFDIVLGYAKRKGVLQESNMLNIKQMCEILKACDRLFVIDDILASLQ